MNKRYQCLSILQMDWKPEMNLSMHTETHSVIIVCVDFSLQITIERCICCLRKDFQVIKITILARTVNEKKKREKIYNANAKACVQNS